MGNLQQELIMILPSISMASSICCLGIGVSGCIHTAFYSCWQAYSPWICLVSSQIPLVFLVQNMRYYRHFQHIFKDCGVFNAFCATENPWIRLRRRVCRHYCPTGISDSTASSSSAWGHWFILMLDFTGSSEQRSNSGTSVNVSPGQSLRQHGSRWR